ncbi:hypothetical protein BD414DRAFT_538707 [Trametes punicea]|nr:hypothetical protein BD414DRAFT_538707 [Trametes punicea]
MIVRPDVSPSFNARRPQSAPSRRRSNSVGAATAEASPAVPVAAHLLVQALHTSSKHGPPSLLRSSSGRRKFFRFKRPSSAHAVKSSSPDHQALSYNSPSAGSPSIPPRPARNPARLHSFPAPNIPGGPTSPTSDTSGGANHARSDTWGPLASVEAAEWEFPLPRGSEFPLQRKKSKSSKSSAARAMQEESAKNDLPFSTLDRAILEELRQKIRAREDQFVIRSGRKYHAFPAEEVPYPRSYDRQMVDLDVWDNLWQQNLGGSVTMHVFQTAPARVLDLGCGTGTWILDAAREWKNSHFVGLDIVPLHPDLVQVGSFDLASRITWVQANFLERLPFPNEEFDYVRLVRVARGVPEDKWDGLLEEITRVMKPGGAFEMWEEDLRFPGSNRETVAVIDTPEPKHVSPPTPPLTDSSHTSEQRKTFAPSVYALPMHRSLAFSYSFDDVARMKNAMLEERAVGPLPPSIQPRTNVASTPMLLRTNERQPINPHDHSLLETIYDEMHAARFINLEPLSLLANLLPLHLRDVRAPPPVVINFPPPREASSLNTPPAPFIVQQTSPMGGSDSEIHEHVRIATGTPDHGILHGRDVLKGETPFVGIDSNRYNGISPAALRRSTLLPGHGSSSAGHASGGLEAHSIAARLNRLRGLNPLPNKTINFDPRALNLILALRVQEVLACAEPMWDWVVDFQETMARRTKTKRPTQASDQLTLDASRRRRHPKEDALMALTREQFDELLKRFELDMKRRMYLGSAVEDRLDWASCTLSTSEERESFEAMCAAWAEYEQRVSSGSKSRSRGFSSSPPPIPHQSHLKTEMPSADADLRDPSPRPGDANGSARSTSEQGPAAAPLSSSTAVPSRLSDHSSPPSSRTGRIFVAWKA